MTIDIHPTALVDEAAQIGAGVRIGPFSIVGADAVVGDGTVIQSHVVIGGHTELGAGCQVFPFASVGQPPQDLKYKGEPSRLVIGPRTVIREHVTINPGTEAGGMVTRIGADCLIMANSHIAHDCRLGDGVRIVNNVLLGGHVEIGDHAILAGGSAVQQFTRIGPHAFLAGLSGIGADLIPFGMAVGHRAVLSGLNVVGMKRHGISRDQIHALRKAYRLLFADEGTLLERVEDVARSFEDEPLVQSVITFIRASGERPICSPGSMGAAASAG